MARKKAVLAITVGSTNEQPPLRISLNRWVFGLLIIVLLGLAALASITVYNLLDGQSRRSGGDNLSTRNSSSTREQEQEKLIKLGEERLVELQKENAARKKDVDDLEARVNELSNSIKSLQQLAKEVEQRLPGGGGGASPQTTPTGSGQTNNSGGVGGSLDPTQARAYQTKYSQIMSEINSLNASITNGKDDIAALDVQVQSYKATLSQQKTLLDSESQKLVQLAGQDGSKPPNVLPANCVLTSPFGVRWSPFVAGVRQMHYGMDIGCFEGTPVAATKSGIVTYVGYDSGYGNRVEVTHAGGWLTLYAHNNRVLAKIGQTVQKGDIIALSGNTGASTGPHIHYELHENGIPIDPAKYLAVQPASQA